jgi:hypothetical protein
MIECNIGDSDSNEVLAWQGFADFFSLFTSLELLVVYFTDTGNDWDDIYCCKVSDLPSSLKHLDVSIPSTAGLAEWQAIALRDCDKLETLRLQATDIYAEPLPATQRVMLRNMKEFGDGSKIRPKPLAALRIGFEFLLRDDTVYDCFDKTLAELGRTLKVLELKYSSSKV